MNLLLAGLVVFLGIHLVPVFRSLRSQLIGTIGETPYKLVFTVISFAGLLMIIYGKGQATFEHVYLPPEWGPNVTRLVMLPVFILLAASNTPSHLRNFLRHPMLIAILLWSVGHLLANGDKASILLFGGFALYAIIDLIAVNFRESSERKQPNGLRGDIIAVVAGVVVYGLVFTFHATLFGVSPI